MKTKAIQTFKFTVTYRSPMGAVGRLIVDAINIADARGVARRELRKLWRSETIDLTGVVPIRKGSPRKGKART